MTITKDDFEIHYDVSSSKGSLANNDDIQISIQRPVYTAADLKELYLEDQDVSFKSKCFKKTKAYCTLYNIWLKFLSFFPVLSWLPNYQFKNWFVRDVSAGLTLGIIQIPQGMAYAMLTSLPAIYGLYNSLVPVMVYFIFGSSRHVSMGTFAITSLMIGEVIEKGVQSASLSEVAVNGTENLEDQILGLRVQYAVTSSLLIGIMQIILGILHSGFISVYLSDPLISGFTTGAAFHIFSSQVKHLVGMRIPRKETAGFFGLFKLYIYIFSRISSVNYGSFIIGTVSAILLYIIKFYSQKYKSKIKFPVPAELIIVILGTGLSYGLKFNQEYNIPILENVPKGFPPITVPSVHLMSNIVTDSIVVAIVAYAINISVAKAFAKKNNYKIDANQELYAYGFVNIAGSFLSCYVAAASLSRSLIQENLGSTQLAGVFACCVIVLALTVLAPLFEPLPNAILASIVLVALKGLFKQFSTFNTLLRTSPMDALVWGGSFVGVICFGVDYGLGFGLIINILITVCRSSRPSTADLKPLHQSEIYCNSNEIELTDIAGIKIFRFQGALIYSNVEYFQERLYQTTIDPSLSPCVKTDTPKDIQQSKENVNTTLLEHGIHPEKKNSFHNDDSSSSASYLSIDTKELNNYKQIHTIILDCSQVSYADIMGVQAIANVSRDFEKINVDFYLVVATANLLKTLELGGLLEHHSLDKIFLSVHDAVHYSQSVEHMNVVISSDAASRSDVVTSSETCSTKSENCQEKDDSRTTSQ